MKILQGDCLIKLKELADNSVDSIVTDPPAGISFMGKSWDTDKGGRDNWIKWMCDVVTECKRVLKPGGHAFVWAIPRTSHWTATAWENAGFEIRDVVAHIFGSGFPKSLNIGKAVDKLQGNEREVVGSYKVPDIKGDAYGTMNEKQGGSYKNIEVNKTKGTSEWEGWGTNLKPAREDWILMRKPLEKGLSIAENCLKWGCGGINIDESRVEYQGKEDFENTLKSNTGNIAGGTFKCSSKSMAKEEVITSTGRFPANLITDGSEEVRECFPDSKSQGHWSKTKTTGFGEFGNGSSEYLGVGEKDKEGGNASRFFKSIIYQAKASKSERNRGCEELPIKSAGGLQGRADGSLGGEPVTAHNNHPTVKPIALMEYLIKMVTPKGGIVLDPFMGSGSTGVACILNGFDFIGIDMTPEYIEIAKARIEHAEKEIKSRLL